MIFRKIVCDGFIAAAGSIGNGVQITNEEYRSIIEAMAQRPTSPDGYTYKLRADTLEWELVELPPEPDPEPTAEDKAEAYDILMGVSK